MMKYMLDLFSGLGGTSEAFLIDQKWEVTRIDNNPLLEDVENIEIVDVMSDNFDIKRPNWDYKRAYIPLEISTALLSAISDQTYLEDWL
jgi:hypothetical protein